MTESAGARACRGNSNTRRRRAASAERIWEYPLRFIENSPIFMVDRVTTPLLILENDGDDAVPWYQGLGIFPVAAAAGQRSLPVELQRRGSRAEEASDAEGLHGPHAAVFRSFPERRAGAGLDEEGHPVHRSGAGEEKINAVYGETGGRTKEGHQAVAGMVQWCHSSEILGQVAQLVERSPEKAGVGGSIPSLATNFSKTYSLFPLQNCLSWSPNGVQTRF